MPQCKCFECLRRDGITDHRVADSQGKYRWPPDGRYIRAGRNAGLQIEKRIIPVHKPKSIDPSAAP